MGHARDAGELHVRRRFFIIMLGPIFVFMASNWLLQNLAATPDLPADLLDPGRAALEASGRLTFLAAVLFYSVVVLAVIGTIISDLCGPLSRRTRIWAVAVLAATQLPVLAEIFSHQAGQDDIWRSYFLIGADLVEAALSGAAVPVCSTDGRILFWTCGGGEGDGLTLLLSLLDGMNVLGGLGVGAISVGAILTLAMPSKQGATLEQRVRALSVGQKMGRRHLYLAGLLLTSGMFASVGWVNWPLEMVTKDARALTEPTAQATLLYFGVFFTLLIVSAFGPVLFVQTMRADALAAQILSTKAPQEDVAKWKKSNGLAANLPETLQSLLAVCAPLIAGFAGSFTPF